MIKGIAGRLFKRHGKQPEPETLVVTLRCLHCSEVFTAKLSIPISLISGFCPVCEWVSKLSAEDVTGYLRFLGMETRATFREWLPK